MLVNSLHAIKHWKKIAESDRLQVLSEERIQTETGMKSNS